MRGLTSDFEILRGDFARILFDATRGTCEYRFGTVVMGIEDHDDGICATFADGTTEAFAFVICADGLGSPTRDIALAAQTRMRYLGAQCGIAVAHAVERFFGSAPPQALLTPGAAARARRIPEDFTLPAY